MIPLVTVLEFNAPFLMDGYYDIMGNTVSCKKNPQILLKLLAL
jgi:hypothetical protein